MNEITKEKFEAYEDVRMSGVTNMFDRRTVQKYAKIISGVNLSIDEITQIIREYSELKKKFQNIA